MSNKDELAKDRTDWAEDRTILANERTFAGWMRTGMACVGVALGLKAVFRDFEPTWIAKATASIFIAASILIFVSAYLQSAKTSQRMDSHDADKQSSRYTGFITAIMIMGACATGLILWFL